MGSYQLAGSRKRTFAEVKKIPNVNFKKWARTSSEAKDIRETVLSIHPEMGPNLLLAALGGMGPLVLAVLGAILIGSEFTWRTSKIRAAHYGWPQSVHVKIIVIVLLSLLLIFFTIIAGIIANRFVWHLALKSIEVAPWLKAPSVSYSMVKQILALTLGMTFYGLLGAFFVLIFYAPGGMIHPPQMLIPAPAGWYPWLTMSGWVLLALIAVLVLPRMQEIS